MMNLEYKTGRDFLLSDIRFDSSLTGCEDVTSTKQALELMKIRNPCKARGIRPLGRNGIQGAP